MNRIFVVLFLGLLTACSKSNPDVAGISTATSLNDQQAKKNVDRALYEHQRQLLETAAKFHAQSTGGQKASAETPPK